MKRMHYRDTKYQNAVEACQPAGTSLVDSLLAWVAPRQCLLCREPAPGMDICSGCMDDLPWLERGCRCCGRAPAGPGRECCAACQAIDAPDRPDELIAALDYEFPVDRLITGLKYSRRLVCGRLLGDLLAIRIHEERTRPDYGLPDFLLPVPLHPWRLLTRGFNQATEIARVVAAEHRLALLPAVARRINNTPRQTGLSRSARLTNVRGAFAITTTLMNARVAVLDDVVTSAATTRELTRQLRRAGAAEVQVWAVARTAG